ncbi:MAG: DUF1194 domain-containing protein [Rhodobacteraceae bacterium]|nr:DUF1194 domain-containing protein [Paracoccaceae bacterium]
MIRALVLLWLLAAGQASANCRQALALGLDVSGSVDAAEYRLQMDGLAAALDHPEIREALLAMPSAPVHLAVYEWSGPDNQTVLLPWTPVTGPGRLDAIVAQLRGTVRRDTSPGTALGAALATGLRLLNQRGECWKRTLDVSGDGKQNIGPHPRVVRPRLDAAGITVNALVIGSDAPDIGDVRQVEIGELSSYFSTYVITGPGAFVQTAIGFQDFEDAMVRKLKRELEGLALSHR